MEDLATIEEWVDYINQIPMMDMISHAKLIGSVSFEEERSDEGYDDEDILVIYQVLAKRFLELEMRVPDMMDNACVSFREIAAGVFTP
jgi:hypothetical protein